MEKKIATLITVKKMYMKVRVKAKRPGEGYYIQTLTSDGGGWHHEIRNGAVHKLPDLRYRVPEIINFTQFMQIINFTQFHLKVIIITNFPRIFL